MNSLKMARKAALSIAEVCETLSLGRTTIFAEIKAGNLRIVKVGRRTLVLASDLERFLERISGPHA